ncbi:MAG: GntR family transcriptional regulator [Saprospiraceae bacterium]
MNSGQTIFDDTPLYVQIRAFIVARIHHGEWQPGDKIPGETALSIEYEVSQGTVRKAIDSLVDNRLLLRRQGKGTYVASHNSELKLFHFFNILPNTGKRRLPVTNVLSVELRPSNDEELDALKLLRGSNVIFIRRVRRLQDEPTIIETMAICALRFNAVIDLKKAEILNNIYELYEQSFGVIIKRAEDKVIAINADTEQASILEVAENTALLCVKRLAFDLEDIPVEFRKTLILTDKYHYSSALS